jgi:hypothetical protein
MPSKPTPTPTSFCVNCGQAVKGRAATLAADSDVQFCCSCGVQKKDDGTCKNPACPWYKKVPVCADE